MDVAPALSVVTQSFGCTSFPEYVVPWCSPYMHYGIDLSSGNASNQPQYATRAGYIGAAGAGAVPGQPGLGTSIVLHMDDGYDMLYGHLSSLAVQAGQRVSAGQIVGYTGSTGYSTGPHAHIEVRSRGNLNASPNGVIDPWPWLNYAAAPPKGGFLMALDDSQQNEVLSAARSLTNSAQPSSMSLNDVLGQTFQMVQALRNSYLSSAKEQGSRSMYDVIVDIDSAVRQLTTRVDALEQPKK